MTWLARLNLTKNDLEKAHLWNMYSWHTAVWKCLPGMPNAKRNFLFRLNWRGSNCLVYVLSEHEPVCPDWCPASGWAVKQIAPSFLEHSSYCFDVLANPTKKLIVHDASGIRRKNGQRVPLIHEDDQRKWLHLKGIQHGFSVKNDISLAIDPAGRYSFQLHGTNAVIIGTRFRGFLDVTDRELFRNVFRKGIGSAKAFGFGMFVLQPIA